MDETKENQDFAGKVQSEENITLFDDEKNNNEVKEILEKVEKYVETKEEPEKSIYEQELIDISTEYFVEHYKMDLDGVSYTLFEVEKLSAPINSQVFPEPKSYKGFTSPNKTTAIVQADRHTHIKYYYKRNKYLFTLKESNGVLTTGSTNSGEYYYGTIIDLMSSVSEGYEFKEWSNGISENNVKMVLRDENLVITPVAKLIEYQINYDLDNGILVNRNPRTYNIETKTFSLENPNKIGYNFTGWKDLSNGTIAEVYVIKEGSTGPKSVKATYKEREDTKYTVEHYLMEVDGNDYKLTDTETFEGTTNSRITPEVKTYEGFISPEETSATINPDGSTVVKYYYNRKKYNLTINESKGANLSNSSKNGEYLYESEINLIVSPIEGYEFNGWSDGNKEPNTKLIIKNNTNITPLMTPITYTVKYELDGGTLENKNIDKYTVESDSVLLNSPSKQGYDFVGWIEKELQEPEKNKEITKGTTGNKQFRACYKPRNDTEYVVEHYWMNVDGNGYELIDKEVLQGITDSKVTPDVKEYDGFTSPQAITEVVNAYGNTVIKYYYNRIKYNLQIDKTDHLDLSECTPSGEYNYGTEIKLKAIPEEGYQFEGWNGGQKSDTLSFNLTQDIEITSKVSLIDYDIRYELDGGNLVIPNPTRYNKETEKFKLNNPEKIGYSFVGWQQSGKGDPKIEEIVEKGSTQNKLFKAVFKPLDHTQYVVKHFKMKIDGENYELSDIDNLSGTTDDIVSPKTKQYNGFKSPEIKKARINGDGRTTIEYYYERCKFKYNLVDVVGIDLSKSTPSGTYYYGETINLVGSLSDGYIFEKWSNEDENIETSFILEDDIEIKPVIKLNMYSITYNLDGGKLKENNPNFYNVITDTFVLNNPDKPGYDFTGWTSQNNSEIEKNVTINKGTTGNKSFNANYVAKRNTPYKVEHYKENNGEDENQQYDLVETEELTGVTDSTIIIEPKNYIGYTIPPRQTVSINGDGSTVVKYYYRRQVCNIVINNKAGVEINIINEKNKYCYGEQITLKAEVQPGYKFENWQNGEKSEEITLIIDSDNFEITSTVKLMMYTISYDLNDGIIEGGNPYNYSVNTPSFSLENPIKEGYKFIGWTGSNGEKPQTKVTVEQGEIGNKHYKANYDKDYFNIIYDLDGGVLSVPNPVKYNSKTSGIKLINPIKNGFKFIGWTDETGKDCGTDVEIDSSKMTGDKKFTAKYVEENENV